MPLRRLVIVPSLLVAVTIVWSAVAIMLVSASFSPTGEPSSIARADVSEKNSERVNRGIETRDVAYDAAEADPKVAR